MPKKILKIIGICLGVIAVLYICWSVYLKIQIDRGNLIKWDNKFYTKEELKKAFPPQEYDVPAKNTPEQVYAAFRQALLDDDIEGALGLIIEDEKDKYKVLLEKYKKENGSLKILGEKYPNQIHLDHEYGNFSSYSYRFMQNNNEINSIIEFIKDFNGYWQIEFI